MAEKRSGSNCTYWKDSLKILINKQSYPVDYIDNYSISRGRRLVVQGYVELAKHCSFGSAARAALFRKICELNAELIANAAPDVLSLTMTQVLAGQWERISLLQYGARMQAAYCERGPAYPLIVAQ